MTAKVREGFSRARVGELPYELFRSARTSWATLIKGSWLVAENEQGSPPRIFPRPAICPFHASCDPLGRAGVGIIQMAWTRASATGKNVQQFQYRKLTTPKLAARLTRTSSGAVPFAKLVPSRLVPLGYDTVAHPSAMAALADRELLTTRRPSCRWRCATGCQVPRTWISCRESLFGGAVTVHGAQPSH